jgi:hypothetical protein
VNVTIGARTKIRMENILGRPDHRAEKEEHGQEFRRQSILGSSDAKKKS